MSSEPTSDQAPAGALLTIDLDAIADNYRTLQNRLGAVACASVVKADGYGLGAAAVAPALHAAGCHHFFVALAAEGAMVRRHLPDVEIYVLNGCLAGDEAYLDSHRLAPVLNDLGQIERWAAWCRRRGPKPAAIHLDTGMNRLGLGPEETERLIAHPERMDGIDLRYYMSHLVSAELAEEPVNPRQRDLFAKSLARLPKAKASFCNSSGIFLGPDYHFDLARPGAALYGVNPTPGRPNPMRPVVRLDGLILQVRDVDSPMTVGYGASHRVAERSKIATISVGYADGYGRSLSNRGHCVIGGVKVPVVGRVSMDLITVDISALPTDAVVPGDTAELLGPEHGVDELAAEAATIGYEILTSLGRRYRRQYIGGPS